MASSAAASAGSLAGAGALVGEEGGVLVAGGGVDVLAGKSGDPQATSSNEAIDSNIATRNANPLGCSLS